MSRRLIEMTCEKIYFINILNNLAFAFERGIV